MRRDSIAANYAGALLDLARRRGDPAAWGVMLGDVAAAVSEDLRLEHFLESPRLSEVQKIDVLAKALETRVPPLMVRFFEQLVRNRRQTLIGAISVAYQHLLDELEGRVQADVTVARAMTDAERGALAKQLSRSMGDGKRVTPVVRVQPRIMGGIIVRIGDRVADGSVRTRLGRLRQLLATAR